MLASLQAYHRKDLLMERTLKKKQTLSLAVIAVLCSLGTGRAMRKTAPALPPNAAAITGSIAAAALPTSDDPLNKNPVILLRENCSACHTLVRVLLRRAQNPNTHQAPLNLITNASWPQLDSLRVSHPSNRIVFAAEAKDLPVTPVAAANANAARSGTFAWGIFGVTDMLDTLQTIR